MGSFLRSRTLHVSICVWMFVCVSKNLRVCVLMYVWMWKVCLGSCSSEAITLFFRDRVCPGKWDLTELYWIAREPQRSIFLSFLALDYKLHTYCHTQLSFVLTWALGAAQVLILFQQGSQHLDNPPALDSHLSFPTYHINCIYWTISVSHFSRKFILSLLCHLMNPVSLLHHQIHFHSPFWSI